MFHLCLCLFSLGACSDYILVLFEPGLHCAHSIAFSFGDLVYFYAIPIASICSAGRLALHFNSIYLYEVGGFLSSLDRQSGKLTVRVVPQRSRCTTSLHITSRPAPGHLDRRPKER